MSTYDYNKAEIAWCPGCGNFGIHNTLKRVLEEIDIPQKNIVMVSGIGQAAKMPQYINVNFVNGLHGRALPVAVGIKFSNPELTVIAEGGDGDMYGEGGNHFIHNIRRNPDITHLVHNNMVYGLTKGQASPTSELGFETPVQVDGVINEPFNPIAVALGLKATFIARAFSADIDQSVEIIKKAINHKGYALVDILHPCVSFNKVNTYQWFKENTYYLDKDYDPKDRNGAFRVAMEQDKLALGVIYLEEGKKTFTDKLNVFQKNKTPLYQLEPNMDRLKRLVKSKTH